MGKGKPRAAKARDFQPCRRCQAPIHQTVYAQSDRLCGPCTKKEWQEHQRYVQQNAVIVAALHVGFTEDLFSSELVIEADGGYFQTVHWHDPNTHQAMADEHIATFTEDEWQGILLEAQTLHADYMHSSIMMDDVETYHICVLVGEEMQGMQWQAKWKYPDGDTRFRLLWNHIHQQSPWLSRLTLTV